MSASLINTLGGSAGFGENTLGRVDHFNIELDLSTVFGSSGINFFGTSYTTLSLSNDGYVYFNFGNVIRPFRYDADASAGPVSPTPGGTSTGSNLVWYDFDPLSKTFTATWDDVCTFGTGVDELNAFQVSLRKINENGDFDIVFRYEYIGYNIDGASEAPGLATMRAMASILCTGLQSQTNRRCSISRIPVISDQSGIYLFRIRNGRLSSVSETALSIAAASADKAEGHVGATAYSFTVTRTGDTSRAQTRGLRRLRRGCERRRLYRRHPAHGQRQFRRRRDVQTHHYQCRGRPRDRD
jgi:hypothetical protein